MEENLRRALVLSRGDFSVFVTQPISLGMLVATLLVMGLMVVTTIRRRRHQPPLLPVGEEEF
ncbi:hypothetical protein NM680_12795 [Paracoccus sp. PS-1]|nr:hypothetical protein [Paracoccus sp. PS1]MDQ7262669.1 hypothetical protein [Paracoccus sp. PS1]